MEHRFEDSCEAIGAQWQVIEAEGAPYAVIEQESVRHDLLVIGKDTDFHLDEDPSIADSVQHLLRETARPLIVCPDTAATTGPVLVTYDGSMRSSRALHLLALLGHVRGRPIHLLSVADDQATATERAASAAELLTKHGHQVTPHGISSPADPSDIICAEVATLGATMVGMAASGNRRIHDFFLGSTTQRLLRQCPCPLFVYH